ncbi:MAG: hypothetical protein K0S33_1848 [Bacteroidetes bacterium]|jgi:hypothetical protein|nr:hypothetical protein [Bacteroidota bacterium]
MEIDALLSDKLIKPKSKTEQLSVLLLEGKISAEQLMDRAEKAKDPVKATCMEVIEYASKTDPSLVTKKVFLFAIVSLAEKAPRIKWESAKVIGNTVHLFPAQLDKAIKGLLDNSEHTGTVVRWSAAYALGEILQLKTKYNKDLIPAIEAICRSEEKASIRKIYEAALKKIK